MVIVRYKSKIDWWFYLLAGVLIAAAVAVTVLWLVLDVEGLWITALILGALDFGMLIPIMLTTDYTFCDDHLLVRCGWLLRERIKYSDIISAKPSNCPLSSPALSLDRIELRASSGLSGATYVSPMDKNGFMEELARRTGIDFPDQSAAAPKGAASLRSLSIKKAVLFLATMAFVVVVMFGGSIKTDFGDSSFTVSATMCGGSETVAYSSIEALELRDNAEHGVRTFGTGSCKLSAGDFSNSEYGAYRLFVLNGVDICIAVRHEGKLLVFNCASREETLRAYERLQADANVAGTDLSGARQ